MNAKKKPSKKGKFQEWLTEDGLTRIESWSRDGLIDKQIAENIGVSERTFTNWKGKFDSISSALKKGKQPVDFQVENALLKRALGFEYEETKTIVEVLASGEKKQKVEKTKKYFAPDTAAAIFWLKNRKPDVWRKMAPHVSAKSEKELEKLSLETKMLEYEVEKFEKSGQVNTLLESLVAAVQEEDGETDD